MSNKETDARLDDLEEKTAFQEDTTQQLNDALVKHEQRIAQLEKAVNALTEQVKAFNLETETEDETPPHH